MACPDAGSCTMASDRMDYPLPILILLAVAGTGLIAMSLYLAYLQIKPLPPLTRIEVDKPSSFDVCTIVGESKVIKFADMIVSISTCCDNSSTYLT